MENGISYEEFFLEKQEPQKRFKSVGELLRESLSIYRSKFKTIFGIMAIPIGFSLLYYDLYYLLWHTNFKYSPLFSVFTLVFYITFWLLYTLSTLSLILSIGMELDIRESFKKAIKLFTIFIWVNLLLATIVAGGFVLGAIPGILFSVWFFFASYVLVFEDMKGFDALMKSKHLVKGKWWGVWWRIICFAIISALVNVAIKYIPPLQKVDYIPLSELLNDVIGSFLWLFFFPLSIAFHYLIYKNLSELRSGEVFTPSKSGKKPLYLFPVAIGSILVSFFSIFFIYQVFIGRDIPPPNDNDLRLTKVEIPREQNALYDLLVAMDKQFLPKTSPTSLGPSLTQPSFSGWEGLFEDMFQGKRLRTREADQLMAKNEELFRYFERALKRPYFQLPQTQDPKEVGPWTLFPELTKIRYLARWGVVKARYLFAHGKEKEAFEWLFKVTKLGQMLEDSPRPAFIQYLVAVAVKAIGLKQMRAIIGKTHLPPDSLKEFARKAEKLALESGKGIDRCLKMEYIQADNFISFIASACYHKSLVEEAQKMLFADSEGPDITFVYRWPALFKPNATRLMLAEIYRAVIKNMKGTYKDRKPISFLKETMFGPEKKEKLTFEEVFAPRHKNPSEEIRELLFEENKLGKLLVLIITPLYDHSFETKCLKQFELEATASLFALRAYKAEKGHLPNKLQELVPIYLSKLPLDPFDGEPLRYSKAKKVIYCVGKDLVDSGGGEEKGYWGYWKDPTFKIDF